MQVIEQRAHILGHDRAVIGGGIVQLAGLSVPAIIKRDHAATSACQRRHPAWAYPVDLLGRGKAVHQHYRLTLAFIEKSDLYFAVLKKLHGVIFSHASSTPRNAADGAVDSTVESTKWCAQLRSRRGGQRRARHGARILAGLA